MKNPSDIRILIAEDDKDVLEALTERFRIFGFAVQAASDGKQAIQIASSIHPDILITDIRMPQINGYELIRTLRANDYSSPKILVISGFSDYTVEALLDAGADGFFAKPFNAASIRDCLVQTLLSPLERWGRPTKVVGTVRIEKRLRNLAEGLRSKEFAFGRAGFFAHLKYDQPKAGEWVEFHFEFRDNEPCRSLTGQGQVVWACPEGREGRSPGVGVEFRYIEEHALKKFLEWVKTTKPKPSIPLV